MATNVTTRGSRGESAEHRRGRRLGRTHYEEIRPCRDAVLEKCCDGPRYRAGAHEVIERDVDSLRSLEADERPTAHAARRSGPPGLNPFGKRTVNDGLVRAGRRARPM